MPVTRRIATVGIIVFLLLCHLWPLTGCSSDSPHVDVDPYTAAPELVAAEIELPSVGVKLSPPADWGRFTEARVREFRDMINSTDIGTRFYPLFPIAAFADSATQSVMYIAEIETGGDSIDKVRAKYIELLKGRGNETNLTATTIELNGLPFQQYLIHNTQVANYKLLGESESGKAVLIEYIMPAPVFETNAPGVKASMATITPAG